MVVLLADDEEIVLKVATRLLEFLKHEVIPVIDGEAALAVLKERSDIQLAILDQSMPGLTGKEVLGELRAFRPKLPVFLSTGHANSEIDDPHVTLLPKPYRIEALEEELAKIGG